jgi:hypothetical protein
MSYDENRISDQIDGGLLRQQELLETIATLRAEKAELIEALRGAVKYVSYSERTKFQLILRKYETK